METIIWTKALSVGIREIDDQHKMFIALLNNFNVAISKGKIEKLNKLLSELLEFARIHFTTEENYFKKLKYPYANEHMIEHEKLILKSIRLKDQLEKKGLSLAPELVEFLKEWLENHLKMHDQKYAKYFKENQLI